MGILALAADERVADVKVTDDELSVRLWDGRTISVPLTWYPRLLNATEEQRKNWRISGGGYGIHWEDIDEDLSTEGLLRGAPAPRQSLTGGEWYSLHRKGQDSNESETKSAIIERVEPDNKKGILEYLVEAEEASRELHAIMETIGQVAKELAANIQQHSNPNQLTSEPDKTAAEDRLNIIMRMLPYISIFSDRIEGILPRFEKAIQLLEESYSAIVSQANPESSDDIEKITNLQNSLSPILEEVGQAKKVAIHFIDMTMSLRNQNLHTEINESSERQAQALKGIISNIEEIESFALRIMSLINEKLGKALASEKATE
jgi:hypothetical protein